MPFHLTSTAFDHNAPIPRDYTCDGGDQSPDLHWEDSPDGTRSFALIVDDPDAPGGTFTHWILFNIPVATRELPAGESTTGTAGRNDFQNTGYNGPCPPSGHGDHRYVFTLVALDVENLNLSPGASRTDVLDAIRGHELERAQLLGHYERTS